MFSWFSCINFSSSFCPVDISVFTVSNAVSLMLHGHNKDVSDKHFHVLVNIPTAFHFAKIKGYCAITVNKRIPAVW
jgi:hypothetical protein